MLAQSVNHVTLDTSSSPTKSERDSANTKPYKHTQTLALRKAKGIVRFWKGWWSDNPSGSRTNFFGRQHLTFNKGGKCDGAKQGIVRFWKVMRGEGLLSFCKGCRNTESEGDSTGLEGYAGRRGV